MHLFTHTYVRFYIEAHLIQVLEAQIASAFELIDFECYQLNQRAGQMRVVPDLLSYMRALTASTESYSKGLAIREKGITKIGKGGSSISAIGAEEELLPGKLGSTSFKGKGVFVTQKQSIVEGERDRNGDHQTGNGIGDARDFNAIAGDIGRNVDMDVEDERERENEVYQNKKREEARLIGWESNVFDF
jgi:hypothetical protein